MILSFQYILATSLQIYTWPGAKGMKEVHNIEEKYKFGTDINGQ